MKQGYAVIERGMEYNDEYYTLTDSGKPLKVFFTYREAELERDKLTLEWAKANHNTRYGGLGTYLPEAYYEELDEIDSLPVEEALARLLATGFEPFDIEMVGVYT